MPNSYKGRARQKFLWTDLSLLSLVLIFGCSAEMGKNLIREPQYFKIELPFELNKDGLFLPLQLGGDTGSISFLWDNHSPSWANNEILLKYPCFKNSGRLKYKTSTADGRSISGDVYTCDSLYLAATQFKKTLFYNIANERSGVIGENLIANGIWVFNFRYNRCIFTTHIDSVNDFRNYEIFPSRFANNIFYIRTRFRHQTLRDLEIDFGLNTQILIPKKDYDQIVQGNKNIKEDSAKFSTPAGNSKLINSIAFDSIQIGEFKYPVFIASNPLVKNKLIGLPFFSRFDGVILDYINHQVFVAKRINRKQT